MKQNSEQQQFHNIQCAYNDLIFFDYVVALKRKRHSLVDIVLWGKICN